MDEINSGLPNPSEEIDLPLFQKIRVQRIRLIYEQLPFALVGESILATFLCIAMWEVIDHTKLITWLLFIYLGSAFWRSILIYLFKIRREVLTDNTWLRLFILGVFCSGIGWGYAGCFFIPEKGIIYQTLVVCMVFGITAAANTLYSPFLGIYALFMVTALAPITVWIFFQNGLYVLLGLSSFIYIGVMLSTSYYTNKLIITSLQLRFKYRNLGLVQRLLEQKIAERTYELRESLSITNSILESTADGILVVDLNNESQYCNHKFFEMWGFPPEIRTNYNETNAINFAKELLQSPDEFVARIQYLYNNPELESTDILKLKNGKVFERYSTPHKLDENIIGRIWSFRDVTESTKMGERIAHQATHDALTGLPNRVLLNDRIQQGISYAKRFKGHLVVLFIDLDNFKYINDNFGHGSGDIVLEETAKRLTSCMRENDTVARFGGDEFVVLSLIQNQRSIMTVIDKIHQCIMSPIKISGHEVTVTVCIGVSIYPKDGKDASALLKNADMAMYVAKKQGRNYYQFYDKTLNIHTKKQILIQSQLVGAIERNEFFLAYQPIICLKTDKVIAVEALLRWNNPNVGLISPGEVIPIAEETGFIVQLGEWILLQACMQNKAWQDQGLRPIRVAVNVSGIQLARDNFVETLAATLSKSQLDPYLLELELTESSIMANTKNITSKLARVKEMGVQVAIDDFGTGYSSFSYLKDFPADKLKIDQTFVKNCTSNPKDKAIIKAIITVGHHLNLLALAEGVETEEQLRLLKLNNCDEIQGYLKGRPTTPEEIAKLLDG